MIKRILGLAFVFISLFSQAQEAVMDSSPQMADSLRENGKIYVVISVIAMIFLALVLFMVYIERKLKKLEDRINKTEKQ
jgi:hypothetical protein